MTRQKKETRNGGRDVLIYFCLLCWLSFYYRTIFFINIVYMNLVDIVYKTRLANNVS